MTPKERSAKWWKNLKKDSVRHERLKEKRRNYYYNKMDIDAYDPVKQKNKACELLEKVGLTHREE